MRKIRSKKGITKIAMILIIAVAAIISAIAVIFIKNNQGTLGNVTSGKVEYDEYKIGDIVKIGTEEFYVVSNSDKKQEKVVLLAKQNIDTDKLEQSADAKDIMFSSSTYWKNEEGKILTEKYKPTVNSDGNIVAYNLTETGEPDSTHRAAYVAYQYGIKMGGTGRLMNYSEADNLKSEYNKIIYGNGTLKYWLGYADETGNVSSICDNEFSSWSSGNFTGFGIGVRPVIEISKSKVIPVTAE